MSTPALSERHISELHDRAAKLGIDRYRLLARPELVEAILSEDPDAETSRAKPAAARSPRTAKDGPRKRGGRRTQAKPREPAATVPEGPVEGKLEISGRGHGFLRLSGDAAADGDVYISASQIRRCELRDGDLVAGPARAPRRGERHPALVHVDTVNGEAPGEGAANFAELTAVPASRPIALAHDAVADEYRPILEKLAADTALLFGHRVLIRAGSSPKRTAFARALATALGGSDQFETVVLLIDELPEELAGWGEIEGVELVSAAADLRSREQTRIAERTAAKAMRAVEAGSDVVLLIDSLSRLAAAADDAGVVKPIFGAGRETAEEDAGSLTVIATTIEGAGDDGAVDRALATTENVLIVLDQLLSD